MKKIFVTALGMMLMVAAVDAQDVPTNRKHDGVKKEGSRGRHHDGGMDKLNLSDDQKAKVKALNEEHRKQMSDLKKQDNITVKESKEKMESLRKDHHAKFQSVLTSEQKAQLEKNKDARREKGMSRDKDQGQRMKQELNLSADQSAKLDASRKEMSEKMKAVRADNSLTDEQKKEKARGLKKTQMESMKSILTEEQLQKMKEGKKHRRGSKTGV
ncbi:MAG: hypothetical protein H7Y42_07330 [Chitinophagaceae bacterium]|nr:hypothetical protein [Chitinophagaceae bacterium]